MPKLKEPFESQLQRVLASPSARVKIRQLVEDELFVIDGSKSKGKVRRNRGQGPKAKGRAGCYTVQRFLLDAFPELVEGDIFVKTTSHAGVDFHLSPAALRVFNVAIEVKNAETLAIFKALKQAELNGLKQGRPYILFFKRANSALYAALPASDYIQLVRDRATR